MASGRKSTFEELNIKNRYAALAPKAFEFLSQMFLKGSKDDKKWATEQLGKGFSRMIPQEVTGKDGGPIELAWQSSSHIPQDVGRKPSTKAENAG